MQGPSEWHEWRPSEGTSNHMQTLDFPMATSKPKSKQEEALQFLDHLDSFSTDSVPPTTDGEAEVLAFIDEITQKSTEPPRPHVDRPISRAGTPTLRKSTERVKLGGGGGGGGGGLITSTSASSSTSSLSKPVDKTKVDQPGGWGWGSVWSTASAAIQQAKTVVDEQVKALPKNDQARKWGEGVIEYAKTAQLDRIGQSRSPPTTMNSSNEALNIKDKISNVLDCQL